jgi:hypothetical protein
MFGGGETTTTTTTTTEATGTYYTVVFYDSDDSILTTQNVLEGSGANAPSNPTKTRSAQYTYTFNNWDTGFSNVTSDLHVRPVFTTTLNMYTVTFLDVDGSQLNQQTIAYGSGATAPANPSFGPTAEFTYSFTGWDVDFSNIVANLNVTAEYTTVTNTYTATFYDEDGTTVLGTSTVNYGTAATAPSAPSKASDAENTYVFTGWSVDFSDVTADISVTAEFVSTSVEYLVSFYDEDGTTLLGTSTVTYGGDATAPASPVKADTAEFDYTFSGWTIAITNITADAEAVAMYTSTVNQYTVSFFDEDGTTVLGTATVDYGTPAMSPAEPFKASDGSNAYSFDGWSADISMVVADIDVSATYVTVPLGQTYDVNFHDAIGNVIDTQTINHGAAATAPAGPAKDADEQYTYTFSGWDTFFTTVSSDLDIYPVYDMEVQTYTVTFFDVDGTTPLWTGQVAYGDGATAPTAPTKPDAEGLTFLFVGWDNDFTNIMGDLDINPVFFGQPIGTFDRQNLVDLVTQMFDPEDVDAQIVELLAITGSASEEEMFTMLSNAMMLFGEVTMIQSAADMQNWYAATKSLGFEKDLLVTVLYNAMGMGLTNDITYALEEISRYTLEFSEKTQMLADYNARLLAFDAEVAGYCLTGINPLLGSECQDYWNALKVMGEFESNYYYELNNAAYDNMMFDYGVWWDIESLQYDALWAAEFSEDPSEPDSYQEMLDDYLAGLTPDEEGVYLPLLGIYVGYLENQFALQDPYFSVLDDYDLGGEDYIRWHLEELFFGNQYDFAEGDPYYYGYRGYIDMIPNVEWSIDSILEEIERAEERYAEAMLTAGFATDPIYEQNMKDLMGTAYDALDAVILSVDQEMFDMVFGLVMNLMIEPQYDNRSEPEFNPMDLLTPENIVMVASKLNIIVSAVYDTLDQTDYDNIKVLVLGYLDDMFEAEGMTPAERTAFLAVIGTTFDKYLVHFQFLAEEIQSFLGSIDEEKVMSVMELIPENLEMMTDIDIAILVSQAYDIIFGDDSFDVSGVMQILVDVYFDITTELNPVPATVDAIKAEVAVFMSDTFALVDIIKDLNPTYISEIEVEQIMELIARGEAIVTWFIEGFESVSDPLVYYEQDMFDEFVSRFLGSDLEDMSLILSDILGTIETEDTYYRVRSLFQYAIGVLNLRSFEGIQEWVGGLETFGHTQVEWVDYVVNILKYVTEENLEGDNRFQDNMNNLLENLTFWQNMLSDANVSMMSIDDGVQAIIDGLEVSLQPDALLFWEVSKANMVKFSRYQDSEWQIAYYLDYMYIEELLIIVEEIVDASNPMDQTQYDSAVADFDAFVDTHGTYDYLNELIVELKDNYAAYYEYDMTTYQPLMIAIQEYENFDTLEVYIYDNIADYTAFSLETEGYVYEIERIEDEIDDMIVSLWFVNVVYDLVNDPVNEPLTEEAMNIILDDLQNMITSLPPESFELIEKVVMMMTEMNDYRRIDDEYSDGPDKFEIPFSAEEIFTFTQDLSALLKLRLDTIDPTEMVALEAYISIVIFEYVDDLDLDPIDATAKQLEINTLLIKYLGFADEALDEVTMLLDGLSVESIQGLMDYIMIMTEGGLNIYEQIIRGAQAIDGILDPTMVDLTVITGILNEIYFDMEYGTYSPSELSDVQAAWAAHIVDVEALIALAASLNPEMIDPADFPQLFVLQQKVMYMGYLFMDPEEILSMPTFGFDYDMLVDIIEQMFEEDETAAVEAIIENLCGVFDLGTTDFEELYYILLGVGSVVQGIDNIESPTELLRIFDGILSLGYTNTEIASFIMNGVMTFLVPELPNMFDTSELQTELLIIQAEFDEAEFDLMTVDQEVLAEIELMVDPDPDAKILAGELWEAYKLEQEAYAIFDTVINNYSWDNEMFQWWVWEEMSAYIEDGDYGYVDGMLWEMEDEEYEMYNHLFALYSGYLYQANELEWKNNDFMNNYGYIMTSFDTGYTLHSYISNKGSELMNYYIQMIWREFEITRYEIEIAEMEEMLWLPQMLDIMLTAPANVTLSEQVLVILLDQVEAWAQNPDINFVNSIPMIFDKGLEGLTAAELSAELLNAGAFIQTLFGTIDAADALVLEAWLIEATDAFAETQTTDSIELAALQAYMEAMVTSYLPGILGIPTEIGDFLLTMDEMKTQDLMDQLMVLAMIDGSDPANEALLIATTATIIHILVGDDSLDYEAVYHPIFGIIFGVNELSGNDLGVELMFMQDAIDGQLASIIMKATYVSMNPNDMTEVLLLKQAVETLFSYITPFLGLEEAPEA